MIWILGLLIRSKCVRNIPSTVCRPLGNRREKGSEVLSMSVPLLTYLHKSSEGIADWIPRQLSTKANMRIGVGKPPTGNRRVMESLVLVTPHRPHLHCIPALGLIPTVTPVLAAGALDLLGSFGKILFPCIFSCFPWQTGKVAGPSLLPPMAPGGLS